MRWRIFSRRKDKPQWRLIHNPEADIADIHAFPSAIAEGRIASRYLLSAKEFKNTLIVLKMKNKGVLVGADVEVMVDEAKKRGIDVARTPRAGRGAAKVVQTISFEEMILNASDECPCEDAKPEDLACLIYTSGTVGKPKGVMLSHKNFIRDCELTQKLCHTNQNDRIIGVLPLFHIFGLANILICGFYYGASIILIPQYSPSTLLQALSKHSATLLMATPTIYLHIKKAQERKKIPLPKTLRLCISGAAPLKKDIIEEFEQLFNTCLCEGYGLTETTSAVSLNPPNGIRKPGSIGKPAPGIEMKIVDENGNELGPNIPGEIIIKGDIVMMGYYNNYKDTEKTIRNGWLYTGDIGYFDEDGYFFITDRKKEIIIKGGFNISPKEIEDVLLSHPAISEAAVIGIKDKERELIKAFIVLKDEVHSKEIRDFCKERLASFKIPDIFEFRDILPKSLTGKVLKKELGTMYIDDRLIGKDISNSRHKV
jgi:long-chain acyl-CoA synthetase